MTCLNIFNYSIMKLGILVFGSKRDIFI